MSQGFRRMLEIEVYDLVLRVFVYHMVDEVAADKSGAACYDDFHVFISPS